MAAYLGVAAVGPGEAVAALRLGDDDVQDLPPLLNHCVRHPVEVVPPFMPAATPTAVGAQPLAAALPATWRAVRRT